MEIYSKKYSIEKWINHPVYVIFCFAVGFSLWTLSFEKKKVETIQLSSFARNLAEVRNSDSETIYRISDEKRHRKPLPKKFKSNPAFQVFEKIESIIN